MPDPFLELFQRLDKAKNSRGVLRRFFVQFPYDLIYLLGLLEKSGHRWEPPEGPSFLRDINPLLEKEGVKLVFDNGEPSSLNATEGLLKVLQIDGRHAEIWHHGEISRALAEKRFPHLELTPRFKPSLARLGIGFSTEAGLALREGQLHLPQDPFKFVLPRGASPQERLSLRACMELEETQPLIIALSPSPQETEVVLRAYGEFPSSQKRPLLVLAPRDPDPFLKEILLRRGFHAASRGPNDLLRSPLGQAEGLPFGRFEIIVLNTQGELLGLLPAADLALVGHNRNLFEPTSQGVPLLYFPGPWDSNPTARELLRTSGGALAIEPSHLAEQMIQILKNPKPILQGQQQALQQFQDEILPVARLCGSLLLTAAVLLRRSGFSSLPFLSQKGSQESWQESLPNGPSNSEGRWPPGAVTLGTSMLPLFKPYDELWTWPVAQGEIRRGDVIVFRTPKDQLIAHRVVKVLQDHGSAAFLTKGDNRPGLDEVVSYSKVVGRAVRVGRRDLTQAWFRRWGSLIAPVSYLQGRFYARLAASRINRLRHAWERQGRCPTVRISQVYHWITSPLPWLTGGAAILQRLHLRK